MPHQLINRTAASSVTSLSSSGRFNGESYLIAIPRWKRLLDVIFILLLLPVVLPLAISIAALIWLVSPGPILFRQERVGFGGSLFMCLKFRTMVVNADTSGHQSHLGDLMTSDAPMLKLDAKGDSRIIPCGNLLRSSALDELPQLINVLRGEMSLVGPRPCTPYESQKYSSWHWERFNALPGLTGLWQVSGKNRTTFTEMMLLDIDYARNMTFGRDLLIIAKTPMVVIGQMAEVVNRKIRPANGLADVKATAALPHIHHLSSSKTQRESAGPEEIFKHE
jgi:lipopolysaccharide/colanic/teichoic acid biosynthesis glycosyltransferase